MKDETMDFYQERQWHRHGAGRHGSLNGDTRDRRSVLVGLHWHDGTDTDKGAERCEQQMGCEALVHRQTPG